MKAACRFFLPAAMLVACGGELGPDLEVEPAPASVVRVEVPSRGHGLECGIAEHLADGALLYRCTDGRSPTELEGSPVAACELVSEDDSAALFRCSPACVRNEAADVNCTSRVGRGRFLLCPAFDRTYRSPIAPADACEFFTGADDIHGAPLAAGYCCR